MAHGSAAPVERVDVSAYTVPTEAPQSDGTLEWDRTTLVLAEVDAGGVRGIGHGYADVATATLIRDRLAGVVRGRDALDVCARWCEMVASVRNLGRPGIASMAVSVLDAALWDIDGAPRPRHGELAPDLSRPGLGLTSSTGTRHVSG